MPVGVTVPGAQVVLYSGFDPLGIRDLLPDAIGQHLKFVLCLRNKNRFTFGGEPYDINTLPGATNEVRQTLGAMSVRVSLLPELNLYEKRGDAGCVSVDMDKLAVSTVTSEVANGHFEIKAYAQSSTTSSNTAIKVPVVDMSRTMIYARVQWNYMLLLAFTYIVGWFGFVLLLQKIWQFVQGTPSNKVVASGMKSLLPESSAQE